MKEGSRLEKGHENTELVRACDEIVFRAVEMPAIRKAVSSNSDKIAAIRDLREMFPEYLPEIVALSQGEPRPEFMIKLAAVENSAGRHSKNPSTAEKPPHDFLIAKAIVDRLWQEKKKQ